MLALSAPAPAAGQDLTFRFPVDTIEDRMERGPLDVRRVRDTRFEGDRTQRVDLAYADSTTLTVKWASAPPGGHQFNNAPRYEVASYRLQRLLFGPGELVVPPTVVRAVSTDTARSVRPSIGPTFSGTGSTLVVLQYWLPNVVSNDVWDARRFRSDTAYARQVANLNVFTFLARHSDSNLGNFLLAGTPYSPRVFAVDNGLTFSSDESDRGTFWRTLRVDRVPATTVDRLRTLTRADLDAELGVLAEWEIRNSVLHPVEAGPNLAPRSGVRRSGNRVQLGLTSVEIGGVFRRLQGVLERVDSGRLRTF